LWFGQRVTDSLFVGDPDIFYQKKDGSWISEKDLAAFAHGIVQKSGMSWEQVVKGPILNMLLDPTQNRKNRSPFG